LSLFTATVTSFFFDQERADDVQELRERLDRIETKLDSLVRDREGRSEHELR
jgi:chaperonin cofactor prefoldin